MTLTENEFEGAKTVAAMLAEGLHSVPDGVKLLGLAMYLAADLSARSPDEAAGDAAIDAFADMAKSEFASMMDKRKKG